MKGPAILLLLCGIIALSTTIYLVKITRENEGCATCQSVCDGNNLACNETTLSLTSLSEEELSIDTSSFKFTDNEKAITAIVKTNLDSIRKFNCEELIVNANVLGEEATCSVNGESGKLIIELGSTPSILNMGGLSVRKHFSSSIVEIVAVKWSKRKNANALTVSLTSDKTHVFKDKAKTVLLNLEASTSSTSSVSFSWKVIKAPSSSAFETLKASLSTISDSSITLRVSNLDIGVYTIQITARNPRSESATSTTSFEVIDGVAPKVSIQNQKHLKFIIGNLYIISPIISFPREYQGSGKISNLKFKYTLVSGPSQLEIIQKEDLLVLSNDYTYIPTEGEYVFKLTVQEEGVPDGSVTFKVTATSLAKRLVFEA